MQSPDKLAYELGLIQTPKRIESNQIKSYILIGIIGTIILGLSVYFIYENHQKNMKRKNNNPI